MDAGKDAGNALNALEAVIARIKPGEAERKEAEKDLSGFSAGLKKHIKGATITVGGSFAKGTWLKGLRDIDIFVRYNYGKYREKSATLSDHLHQALRKAGLRCKRLHGSRDYFQVRKGGYNFELIPILDIKSAKQAKNITDVSPLHAKWVSRKINAKQADHARLLKAFCKAQGCYGAETHIKGFSGYVCEILVANYGSSLAVLRAALKWKDKEVVDAERHYKGRNLMAEMNASKTQSPLIVVDPVQPDRNAAAALSSEVLGKFVKAAKKFLKKPSQEYFEEKHTTLEELKRKAKGNKLIAITATPLKGKRDVVCTKILKIEEYASKQLAENGFKVIESGTEWDDKALVWLIVGRKKLDTCQIVAGPPLSAEKHVERFRKKHKKAFARNGRAYAKVKRRYTEAIQLVRQLLKEPYVKERAKEAVLND